MKVIIFTEAGSQYGYGHVIRCMALYDEIFTRAFEAKLIVNSDTDLKAVLGDRQYIIENWYEKIDTYLSEKDFVIIDSYHATAKAYETASSICSKALFIDDTNRIKYPRGIIVNPGINADKIPYEWKDSCIYLLGADYTIIRREFCENVKKVRKAKDKISNILVLLGGADICGLTPEIMKILAHSRYDEVEKHIVIGGAFSNIGKIGLIARKHNFKLYYDLDATKLKDLMIQCDVAIVAAGQTINELIAVELPFICLKVIDNQDNNIRGLLRYNIIQEYYDAESENGKLSSWLKEQMNNMNSISEREKQIGMMRRLDVKGGVSRIIDKLQNDAVLL